MKKKRASGADKAQRKFDSLYRKHLAQVRDIALTVLVWGQSPAAKTDAARKRKEIRDKLIELGHNALFSEDIATPADGKALPENVKELAQARAADFVIILIEDSPGALAEAANFGDRLDIGPKLFVLAPKAYEKGYAGQGTLKSLDGAYGGVHWYENDDLVSCNVLTTAVGRVEARRARLYLGKTR